MNAFKTWVLAVCVIALAVCSVQLIQAHQAIDAWQVEVERLNDEVTRLEVQTESDYYRGVMSACVGIGITMEVPREVVATRCASFMRSAYGTDWYNKLQIDTWEWPPKKE